MVVALRSAARAPCISTAMAVRSCSVPVSEAANKNVTTIEGLAQNNKLHAVQQAGVDGDVPQCGYCQSGMIMAVAALLKEKPKPTDADIDEAITNICRCGTYNRIRAAHSYCSEQGVRGDHELYAEARSPRISRQLAAAGLTLGLQYSLSRTKRLRRRRCRRK